MSDKTITADVRRCLTEQCSWGRWGDDDEVGAVNLITAEKRVAAARLVRSGRTISLSRKIPTRATEGGSEAVVHHAGYVDLPDHPGSGAALDYLGTPVHGVSVTHLDALCHIWEEHVMWGGRDPRLELDFSGAQWGAIDVWRDGIMTRGVLLDVTRYRSEPFVTMDRPVHGQELMEIAADQGTTPKPGDAIVVHSGRDKWDEINPPWGLSPAPGYPEGHPVARPGLHASCLTVLREWDCAVLVWDMMDHRPCDTVLPWAVHTAIPAFGMALVDNAALDVLAEACRQEDRWEFLFAVAPLPLPRGTGSPVNPLAIL